MESVILVIHLIVAIAIIIVIMLQPSESGGFMGSSGSMSNMMAPRRTADIMTRITTILAGCFFLTSLSLGVIAGHRAPQKSIIDTMVETPAATAPVAADQKAVAPDTTTTDTTAPDVKNPDAKKSDSKKTDTKKK
jgi:preprotein translocase subunit SecG